MITPAQLKETARGSGINPYYEEKEYLQHIFLYNLFRINREFVFKGGTCLRIAYKFSRFSEDLDFNSEAKIRDVQKIVDKTLESFKLLGIRNEYVKKELFDESYTAKIRFHGPLYSEGRTDSANSIQIDVGKRDKVLLEPKWVQINPPYPDVPRFFVQAMNETEILAEKIRALYMRSLPRDLFDAWSMINAQIKPDMKLVEKKMTGKKKKAALCTRREYERDLKNLLPVMPPYKQVISDLKKSKIIT
ncbi:MAG: nucleotidyl transferase AbiEii/AbiGii toxin family protein [Candidatus Altiarchaeota archaeon]|nr:nucleotidyl transferase AbiEii/AbiGii toxin family protein [Candidatus Altiarchaeota archaeon]